MSNCPANIRAKRHESGCLHNCFPDKDLGVHELAFALGKDSTALKQRYEQGMESLKSLVLLERCLDWVRVRNCGPVCSCGAVLSSSACTSSRCRNKRRLAKLQARYPFSVEPLEITAADIGKLFHWRADLERVFKMDLLRILEVSPETFARYTTR